MMRPDTNRTMRQGLLLAVALFAVGTLPFAYAWATTRPDRVYTGLMFDVPDHAQYWSWVTESRRSLFIANTMTPEPNAAVFVNPMMWLLARVQHLASLSFAGLMQVWRAMAAVLLGVAVVAAMSEFVADSARRRSAIWMSVAGAGFGWVLVVAKRALRLVDVPFPQDLYIVEANTFFASFAYPYLGMAQGLVLLVMLGVWRVHRGTGAQGLALAVTACTLLALFHAYDLITVYAVVATYWLRELVRLRRVPARLTVIGLLIGACSAPIALYYRSLTATDPLWQSILVQYANAGVWTPPHVHLVILMGLPLLLALLAFPAAWRSADQGGFLATWAVVGVALIYLPTVFQVKLLTGWQFPLAILAAHAWHDRVVPCAGRWLRGPSWSPERRARAAAAILVALVIPTNVYLFAWRFVDLRRNQAPFFLHRDEMAALEFLATTTGPDDVVLAPLDLGQFVPNYGRTRAYLAHWAMTNRFFERRAAVARFFDPATTDIERARILDRDRVTLVLRGSGPEGDLTYDPAGSPLFEPVFQRPHAAVFRYRGGGAVSAPARSR